MTILGTILAIILAIGFTVVIGPFGGLLLIAIIFGLVFSTHQRNKRIFDDLQRIKEKLGIEDKDEFNMKNEEIEKELEQELKQSQEASDLSDLNKENEKELEDFNGKNKGNEDKNSDR
ncbi:hypothetical protein Back11_05880 [Paenibacillus baekrokdamisoli]|uniref:Uncharacterized protein n=1 Tax=Paenibacillus baekrokdamisoli TaxID=1712516 RepID=A0A3G9J3F5_9BACL|nr:hypothetical protein [Paenibacillus baekrokdamisoli]MBB3067572.1 uncharacterized membrane protein (DUF106 family) [Paenibacillus baekrokdamisoli]BBH19243.1 hypothetical protein Back11_05880 [Paenibacillus baekrokdamisoli]